MYSYFDYYLIKSLSLSCVKMQPLEYRIYDHLITYQRNNDRILTIGTVESASGGRIADKITNVSGISDYFKGAIVCYSNEIKQRLMDIDAEIILKKGAVSKETAILMAQGGKQLLNVDVCISDTGIAGPKGATPTKPVGLFYLGLFADDSVICEKHLFQGDRESNKQMAVESSLALLESYLSCKLDESTTNVSNVVTSFIRNKNKILIVKRSQKVGTYKGLWSGISGYLEQEPLDQAYREISEETSLGKNDIQLIRKGIPFELYDTQLKRKWIIHPFLFETNSPEKIVTDWENVELTWISPTEIKRFNTVPGLQQALINVTE
jgi:nicotinamide-nucleotide amidase